MTHLEELRAFKESGRSGWLVLPTVVEEGFIEESMYPLPSEEYDTELAALRAVWTHIKAGHRVSIYPDPCPAIE